MKTLQKSLLSMVITVLFLDLFVQLTNHQQLATLINKELFADPLVFWVYPLAFIFGSIVTGYLLYYCSHFSIISLGLFLVGLIQGAYPLITTVKTFIYFRAIHGFLTATILTVVFSWLSNLMEKENERREFCKFLLLIPLFSLALLPLHQGFTEKAQAHWSIFILMFAFIFISVLTLFLMGYLTGLNKQVRPITLKAIKETLGTSGLIYYCLASITSAYTLGTLFQTIIRTELYPIKASPMLLSTALLVAMTLSILTKIGAVANEIGDTKGILMALLIMAFGLSLLPLLTESVYLLIPIGLCGVSFGILIPCIYGGIKEKVGPATRGLIFGLLHGLLLLGYMWGWTIAGAIYQRQYSPYFVNSLLIISVSIIYIKQIHQQAPSYKI